MYLDAALTAEGLWNHKIDVQLGARNLTDNRDPVASVQQRQSYTPRGIEAQFTVTTKF